MLDRMPLFWTFRDETRSVHTHDSLIHMITSRAPYGLIRSTLTKRDTKFSIRGNVARSLKRMTCNVSKERFRKFFVRYYGESG